MKLADKILNSLEISEASNTETIKKFNNILNDFQQPLIHLKKHVKFEFKNFDKKNQKALSDLVSKLENTLKELDEESEKALFNEV